jgi:D-alanyl-D-alanine carboxypeptidase (penicillin-binding protein 5/6)
MMNARAAELGMGDTHFVNCTGLDDGPEAAAHRTSAHDIAVMSRELLKNHPDIKKYTTIWMDTVRGGTFGLSNTNKLIRFYSGATGLKTGFTSGAGYCLSATAEREGMELIAVVMGAQTSKERNAACKQLLDMGFANYALVTPQPQEETSVAVKLGSAESVRLIPGQQPRLLIDKGLKGSVTTDIALSEAITAPVAQGQELGRLTIRAGEKILAEIPLVAETEVLRLTWGQLFALVMKDIAMGSIPQDNS